MILYQLTSTFYYVNTLLQQAMIVAKQRLCEKYVKIFRYLEKYFGFHRPYIAHTSCKLSSWWPSDWFLDHHFGMSVTKCPRECLSFGTSFHVLDGILSHGRFYIAKINDFRCLQTRWTNINILFIPEKDWDIIQIWCDCHVSNRKLIINDEFWFSK